MDKHKAYLTVAWFLCATILFLLALAVTLAIASPPAAGMAV